MLFFIKGVVDKKRGADSQNGDATLRIMTAWELLCLVPLPGVRSSLGFRSYGICHVRSHLA